MKTQQRNFHVSHDFSGRTIKKFKSKKKLAVRSRISPIKTDVHINWTIYWLFHAVKPSTIIKTINPSHKHSFFECGFFSSFFFHFFGLKRLQGAWSIIHARILKHFRRNFFLYISFGLCHISRKNKVNDTRQMWSHWKRKSSAIYRTIFEW